MLLKTFWQQKTNSLKQENPSEDKTTWSVPKEISAKCFGCGRGLFRHSTWTCFARPRDESPPWWIHSDTVLLHFSVLCWAEIRRKFLCTCSSYSSHTGVAFVLRQSRPMKVQFSWVSMQYCKQRCRAFAICLAVVCSKRSWMTRFTQYTLGNHWTSHKVRNKGEKGFRICFAILMIRLCSTPWFFFCHCRTKEFISWILWTAF